MGDTQDQLTQRLTGGHSDLVDFVTLVIGTVCKVAERSAVLGFDHHEMTVVDRALGDAEDAIAPVGVITYQPEKAGARCRVVQYLHERQIGLCRATDRQRQGRLGCRVARAFPVERASRRG